MIPHRITYILLVLLLISGRNWGQNSYDHLRVSQIKDSIQSKGIKGFDSVQFTKDYYYRSAVKASLLITLYFPEKLQDFRTMEKRLQKFLTRNVSENPNAEKILAYIKTSGLDLSKADLGNIADGLSPKIGLFEAMQADSKSEEIALYLQNDANIPFIIHANYLRIVQKVYKNPEFINELRFLETAFGIAITDSDLIRLPANIFTRLIGIAGLDGKTLLENIKRLIEDGHIDRSDLPTGFEIWKVHSREKHLRLYKEHYMLKAPVEIKKDTIKKL